MMVLLLLLVTPDILTRAETDARSVRLSDVVQLTLSIEGPAPLRVELPELPFEPITLATWSITPNGPARVVDLGMGRQRWTRSFTLDPFQFGPEIPVRMTPATVRAGSALPTSVGFDPIDIAVAPPTHPPDIGALRPETGIEAVPSTPTPTTREWGLWWLVPGFVLIGLSVWWIARRKPRSIPMTPAQVALARLDALTIEPSEAYFAAVAELLRSYFESAWNVPASRRTTPEMLREVQQSKNLPPECGEALGSVLDACDQVKFGQVGMSETEASRVHSFARELIARLSEAREDEKFGESREVRQGE